MAQRPKLTDKASNEGSDRPARTLSFEYIKSGLFRVIHADGAIGAVTPAGNVHLAFYSERPAMPNITVHNHSEDGSLGPPISSEKNTKANYVREIDVDVVFDVDTAEAVIKYLKEFIELKSQSSIGTQKTQGRTRRAKP